MPSLRRKGRYWYLRTHVDGRNVEIATRCTDKKAAEAFQRRWERDEADPESARRRAAQSRTVQDAIDLALARHTTERAAGRIAEDTLAYYERKLGVVLGTLGPETPLIEVDASRVDALIAQRRAEGASDHTVFKELSALETALKLARRAGWWPHHVEDVMPERFSPHYEPRDRVLSIEDVTRVVEHLRVAHPGTYRRARPDRAAWVALAAGAGAELAALEAAQRGDWDEAAGLVRVRGTKNDRRDREVPVVLPACRRLVTLAFALGEGAGERLLRPWGKNWRDLQDVAADLKLEPFSLHTLRHSFATWHLAAGLAFDDVARALGHADTTMLHRVYGHLSGAELRDRFRHLLGVEGTTTTPAATPDGKTSHHLPTTTARAARPARPAHGGRT